MEMYLLLLGAALFSIGSYGVLTSKNLLVILMSIEIMLSSCSLCFVVLSSIFSQGTGQVFVMFIIAIAGAEAAIGLAILLAFYRQNHSVETDKAEIMKG